MTKQTERYKHTVDMFEESPKSGSQWIHHSGKVYEVVTVTNTLSDKWETTVVYYDSELMTHWSRPLDEFLVKFKHTGDSEDDI